MEEIRLKPIRWVASSLASGAEDMKRPANNRVTPGSGNVFVDLEVREPDEALAKAELARQIAMIIEQEGLTQSQAAALLGIDQPKVSALLRGRLRDFSIERLMRFILRLGHNVQIGVLTRKTASPRLRVAAV
jgi:predicted XRE-type DNA-binding protein